MDMPLIQIIVKTVAGSIIMSCTGPRENCGRMLADVMMELTKNHPEGFSQFQVEMQGFPAMFAKL